MSAPQWSPVDDDTQDLLALVASDPRKADDYTTFLDACRRDAMANGGQVSVNRVRELMSNHYGLTIHSQTYSSFWNRATGTSGPMVTTKDWDVCNDKRSGNGGKPQRFRRWVGESA